MGFRQERVKTEESEESVYKCGHRGTLRNTWQTFLLQQNNSFVSTLGRRFVTKSVWTRLLTCCSKSQCWDLSGTCWWRNVGVRSQKEDPSFSKIRSYHCLSNYGLLCKEHRSKIQNSAKGNQEERSRIQMCRVNVPPFFSPSTYLWGFNAKDVVISKLSWYQQGPKCLQRK